MTTDTIATASEKIGGEDWLAFMQDGLGHDFLMLLIGFGAILTVGSVLVLFVGHLTEVRVHRSFNKTRAAESEKADDVWSESAVAVTRHNATMARWDEWHTDLDLLIEYPAIHDVAHEKFAVRIIDTAEEAKKARELWVEAPASTSRFQSYVTAVDVFDRALFDGEHQAKLLGRGPSLDPVLKRVMDDAAHLVEVLRRPDTSRDGRDRTMRALFNALKPVVGDRAVKIPELEPFVMKQITARTQKVGDRS